MNRYDIIIGYLEEYDLGGFTYWSREEKERFAETLIQRLDI